MSKNTVKILPGEMSLGQAISFCHMLDYEGRQNFLGILTETEREVLLKALFQVNDKVIVKRIDGSRTNGTVVAIRIHKVGYYKVAYIVDNQVTVKNVHHSRMELGILQDDDTTE
ncbi:MAG: hypothetical protein OXI43_13910 [Candidatus Poribacteria bacterium]|nr:hypothetical protein [Candidatus Poribacteria bacterium]